MKIKQLIIVAVILLTAKSNAQIKVFSGGSVTIGAITSPTANAVMHQIIGSKTAFPSTNGGVTFAPMIVGYNNVSSASAPDFTWLNDANTGVFHPASDILGFSAGGEVFRINSTKQILNSNSSSSASNPDYSWDSDNNTGIFRYGADMIGFSTGGYERFRLNSNGQLMSAITSSVALPDFSWIGDSNTGMYTPGGDKIGFSTGGYERLRINSNGQLFSYNGIGTAAYPDYSWGANTNTGMFNLSTNVIGFSTNGVERMQLFTQGYIYIGTTPRTSAMWTDGQLTIGNPTTNDHCLIIKHTTNNDGYAAIISELDRANSETYNVWYNSAWRFKVLGDGSVYYKNGWITSDQKLKTEIKTIDKPLEKILALRGVTYKYKDEVEHPEMYGTARLAMGVIAQEIEQVLPEAVRDFEGTKAVAYTNLISLCIEAIKEQNGQIAKLQNDLNTCCSSNQNRTITPLQNGDENKNGEGTNGNINTGSYIKQNSPNPFNKETVIEFFIAEKNASSSVLVFDMNGKLLKTLKLEGTGKGSINISANDFKPGMYYYSLIINNKEIDTKKMILTE